MPIPHSSVRYIEPNYIYSGLTAAANDGYQYDRAPDLEDYCIALNIGVEVSSREDSLRKQESDNKVIIMVYKDNGKKSTVSFMSGTRIGGYNVDGSGNTTNKLNGTYNAFTTYPMDMYVTDLVDYGTTEMIGIKSVDINYDSGYIPRITIQFTDVRGMSVFQPKELNYSNSFNGIRGLSKDNIAQTFFQCFFTLPLPKFTIQVKGFYGRAVTYQMMCDKFVSNFNSSTGDFDITATFIGYGFSFMSDIAFDALIAAPYSDYKGRDYWDSQVKAGRFKIPDKNGTSVDMPKLFEIRENFETLIKQTVPEVDASSMTNEEKYHTKEKETLVDLKDNIVKWYETLNEELSNKYGKEFCHLFKSGDGYDMILFLVNDKTVPGNDLSELYKQLSNDFRNKNEKLYAQIDGFNYAAESFSKIKNVSKDFSNYAKSKIFKRLYLNPNSKEIVFDGFANECTLPRQRVIKTVFHDNNSDIIKKKIYNDGIDEYIYGFAIELDYSGIERRLQVIRKLENESDDEKTHREKVKRINQEMFAKMKWYPTIENFTKVVMAHLETLMAMMYDTIQRADGRTVADMNISLDNLSDVPATDKTDKQVIPPFPRVTRIVTGDDGISKREDAWIGEFNPSGDKVPEIDIVNGLFNGVFMVAKAEEAIQNVKKENEKVENEDNNSGQVPPNASSSIKLPLTPYDFFTTKNIYGYDSDIASNRYAFVGKVAFRMFNILGINSFRYEHDDFLSIGDNTNKSYAEQLGEAEAINFKAAVTLNNTEVFKAISEGGTLTSGTQVLETITEVPTKDTPWGKEQLFTFSDNTLWLDKYKVDNDTFIYPAQNMSFSNMEEVLNQCKSNIYNLENDEVIISNIDATNDQLNNYIIKPTTNLFYNLFIEDNINRFTNIMEEASSEECYSGICDKFFKPSITYDAKTLSNVFFGGSKRIGRNSNGSMQTISTNACSFTNRVQQSGRFSNSVNVLLQIPTDYASQYILSKENVEEYMTSNGDPVNNCVLSEVFGYNYTSGGGYSMEIDKSFLLDYNGSRKNVSAGKKSVKDGGLGNNIEIVFFLMGISNTNFENIAKQFGKKKSFIYLPKFMILQIGAILAVMKYEMDWNLNESVTKSNGKLSQINKLIPTPYSELDSLGVVIDEMNPMSKMYLIKYFLNWCRHNMTKVNNLYIDETDNSRNYHSPSCIYSCYFEKDENKKTFKSKVILSQDNKIVKELSNDLLSLKVIVRGNTNSFKKLSKGVITPLTRKDCAISRENAIAFFNGFLNKLRQLHNIGDEHGNLTAMAATSKKSTDDMKIELYRYLKQIFDKWIPCTTFDDWKYETFFPDMRIKGETNKELHDFHFIDSYFNKINKKLIISPKKLSDKIGASLAYTDINVMMHTFLSDVYAEHRCMLRCIQNFANLANDKEVEDMFTPLPYSSMCGPKAHPDFVVVYTYEPSKNLNIDNGEFKDDGFMLNDETETPLAITSRSDNSNYYKMPAFGVSYGKQYQNYFKNVNVNMSSPIQTQQALLAKHAILRASREPTSKVVTAQDLYDIYSTQSYTCDVEMMGCAWIQPMMYFVLLNIPMFRGSYMIMKVNHKITPGNMTTTFTGCRMANVSNRFIEDIFSDEDEDNSVSYESGSRESMADVDNDCPYKVYPLIEDNDFDITADELTKAKALMKYLTEAGASEIAAAGIVGNMYVESTYNGIKFNSNAIIEDSDGFTAGGLVMWNDRYWLLTCLINNEYEHFGNQKYDGHLSIDKTKQLFNEKNITAKYQCNFLANSMKLNKNSKFTNLWSRLNSATTPDGAADDFCRTYENPNLATCHLNKRKGKAKLYYQNKDKDTPTSNKDEKGKPEITEENIHELLFNALQKTMSSSNAAAAKIKYEVDSNNKMKLPMIITLESSSDKSKLANLYDIILNTDEYYQYVQELSWGYTNSPQELPCAIIVKATLKPSQPDKRQWLKIRNTNGYGESPETIMYDSINDETKPVNDKLLLSLVKKYGDVKTNKNFAKENPQFRYALDLFDDINITNCDNLMGGNSTSTGSGTKITEGGMIANWNANKAINWLVCATNELKSQQICAFAVQQAVVAGGIEVLAGKGGGWRQAVAMYESGKWDLLESGTVESKEINFTHKLQVGDVIGMTKGNNENDYGHIAMYCGSEKRWVSDFQQGNPYVYTYDKNGKKRPPGKYWLIRYKGGEKSTTQKPGRCYNGKCLNNCTT